MGEKRGKHVKYYHYDISFGSAKFFPLFIANFYTEKTFVINIFNWLYQACEILQIFLLKYNKPIQHFMKMEKARAKK